MTTFDALRVRFDAAIDGRRRATIAHLARQRAAKLGVAAPAWAAVRPARADRYTLEALQAAHDASSNAGARAKYRLIARHRSRGLGVEVPPWAAIGVSSVAPQKPARISDRSAKAVSLDKRTAKPVATPVIRRARPAPARGTPTAAVDIPAPLRRWREGIPGAARVVQLRGDRVVLHEFGEPARKFASVADAVAAVG